MDIHIPLLIYYYHIHMHAVHSSNNWLFHAIGTERVSVYSKKCLFARSLLTVIINIMTLNFKRSFHRSFKAADYCSEVHTV